MLLIKKYKGIRKEYILNLFENLNDRINKTLEKAKKEKNIKPSNIYEDELNLAKKLDAIEEYTIERFEENIVVLENRENQKMINVGRDKIPEGVKEGDIVEGKFNPLNKAVDFTRGTTECVAWLGETCEEVKE